MHFVFFLSFNRFFQFQSTFRLPSSKKKRLLDDGGAAVGGTAASSMYGEDAEEDADIAAEIRDEDEQQATEGMVVSMEKMRSPKQSCLFNNASIHHQF